MLPWSITKARFLQQPKRNPYTSQERPPSRVHLSRRVAVDRLPLRFFPQ